MVKKRVPDWLNSSLWSSPHPPSTSPYDGGEDYRLRRSSSAEESPVPVPPPLAATPEPPKVEIRDRMNDSSDNGGSGSGSPSVEDISRQAQLVQEVINMGELRRLASQGIPDGAGIRSTVWKLLLGYLPVDRGLWSSELPKKRSQYKHFKEELLMNPSEITRRLEKSTSSENEESKCETRGLLPRSEITQGEHPLSLGKTSIWNQFFQDTEIIEQIDRDVKRTHPDMHFFSGDSQFAKSNQEALKNILIVFAKLNPGIRYVQGMNEILAPLFYVFRNDPNEENAAFVEADTFFCFVELLSGFRDHFCQQLDNSVVGIRSTITKLSRLLKEHDEELWRHLEVTTKVNPQFYAFRWITLLLTQEFNFSDSLLIWDTLLSDPEGPLPSSHVVGPHHARARLLRNAEGYGTLGSLPVLGASTPLPHSHGHGARLGTKETLLRVCIAMLILVRRRLLAGDFTSNLKLLQHYPSTNISHLLYVANKLRIVDIRVLVRWIQIELPKGKSKFDLLVHEFDLSCQTLKLKITRKVLKSRWGTDPSWDHIGVLNSNKNNHASRSYSIVHYAQTIELRESVTPQEKHEKHKEEKDPTHAHKPKIEEEVAVGASGYAYLEYQEKKEANNEEEDAHGKDWNKSHRMKLLMN
ncbi:Ypt/Rab-GAP domain of gyp1p superfamily protein [Actinidia rufa]|uniref:Ypt/Rab-GAP domain of gyp1p superfamily protein n=1 Tax=Actinidia rufa TaxID=165716 RepID=A0A7J0F310_9ERIC|nr:Ypt/Rab-GAP domain of gyp1p superfamily protein [Actinidia rufa]